MKLHSLPNHHSPVRGALTKSKSAGDVMQGGGLHTAKGWSSDPGLNVQGRAGGRPLPAVPGGSTASISSSRPSSIKQRSFEGASNRRSDVSASSNSLDADSTRYQSLGSFMKTPSKSSQSSKSSQYSPSSQSSQSSQASLSRSSSVDGVSKSSLGGPADGGGG